MNLKLKLHAWIYRRFGIYTEYARMKEQEFTKKELQESDSKFIKNLLVSTWQARHGFYRTSKQVKRDQKKRTKKYDKR